jgi:hypothetical protein
MSDPTPTATIATNPSPAPESPLKKYLGPVLAAALAGLGGFGVAKFSDTHKDPAPITSVDNKPSSTNVASPGGPPRQVQVVVLFECQYLVTENPFFMVHLPRCTNHPAAK